MIPTVGRDATDLSVLDAIVDAPACVSTQASFHEAAQILSRSLPRYVLVADENQTIAGIVSCQQLLTALVCRLRNSDVDLDRLTMESVLASQFLCTATGPSIREVASALIDCNVDCIPIIKNGHTVGNLELNAVLEKLSQLKTSTSDRPSNVISATAFDQQLQREWDRARRQFKPIGLLVVQVDQYFDVIKQNGLSEANSVMDTIGDSLVNQLRSYDVVARCAADRFAAICSECQMSDLESPIRRILQATQQSEFDNEFASTGISLSVGAAAIFNDWDALHYHDLLSTAAAGVELSASEGGNRAYRTEVKAEQGNPSFELITHDNICVLL